MFENIVINQTDAAEPGNNGPDVMQVLAGPQSLFE